MALKSTIKEMHHLLSHVAKDLVKAEKGNKAAAQRVRTGTIKLEKKAKLYRKESIAELKKIKKKCSKKSTKKPVKKAKAKKAKKKTAKRRK